MRTKQKVYSSPPEFEADRKKMWSKGWLVAEQRMVPVARPSWAMLDSGSLLAYIVMSPLLLLGWLIYRGAPAEELVVTYARRGDSHEVD